MTSTDQDMAAIVPLRCEMADPVDGLCRVATLLRRCGIEVVGLDLRPADAPEQGFVALFRLAAPLPFAPHQLEARLAAIPAIRRADMLSEPAQTPMSGNLSRTQPAIRQAPSSSCRMV